MKFIVIGRIGVNYQNEVFLLEQTSAFRMLNCNCKNRIFLCLYLRQLCCCKKKKIGKLNLKVINIKLYLRDVCELAIFGKS